jgi:hypothetical protein
METGISPEKLLQRRAFVGTGVIQQHNHGTVEMSKQVAEEQTHFFLPNIVIEEVVVEVQSLPFRADRDAGDHGNFVAPIDMTMNRSLPDRSPGLGDMGNGEIRTRRQTLCGRPAERLFFYPRPLSAFPLLDRLVVALDRAPFGFLMTPLQTMHQPPNVIGVVVDSELLVDEQGDARRRPQVCAVAASHRPFEQ